MAIDNFIPQIWSAAVQQALQDTTVLAPVASAAFAGDGSSGNQVKVTGVIPPTITDYAAAGRTTTAEAMGDSGDSLLINQEKSFDFTVDDIDKVQAAGSFEAWTMAAGRSLGEDADAYIAARAIAGGTNDTVAIGGATSLNTDNDGVKTWNAIRDLRKQMNKAKVPQSQRFLALNAEAEARLLASAAKLTNVDTSGTPDGLRDATLGRLLGFTLLSSEQLTVTDYPQLVAFWQPALAYVSQVDKVEAMRSNEKFADRVRGLHVYGAKVLSMYATAVRFFSGAAV